MFVFTVYNYRPKYLDIYEMGFMQKDKYTNIQTQTDKKIFMYDKIARH